MERKASILIVDDDAGFRKTMSFVMGHKGYGVATAKDGLEAIALVREKPFDVVLMDIKMPLMDGVETYGRIKTIRPESVVLMMTAYAVEDLVQQALQEGAHAVVYKPLDIERVVALIEGARESREGLLALVVDDDPGTSVTLKDVLIKRGHKVGISQTGEDAIAMARQKAHDIVFIAVKLPTINGLETYLAIREINPEVVAIMMTAYRQEAAELVEQALNNTAYACLYKPLDIEVVLKLVAEIWQRKQKA
jgi:two-component system response regulator HydG